MAKVLKQTVVQDSIDDVFGGIPKRIIVQWKEDTDNSEAQKIVDYDSMTVEAKAIYDTFVQLCEVYMNE